MMYGRSPARCITARLCSKRTNGSSLLATSASTSGLVHTCWWTSSLIEGHEALEFAVLLLLERLAPMERAAYILREAFDYPYDEIGKILKVSEANARQLVTRARKHIAEGRRKRVDAVEQRRLLDTFIAAAQKGELAPLEALFASDVVSYSDGGGLVRAAGKPLMGRERVARFISVATHFWRGVTVSMVEANGQGCALISRDGAAVAIVTVGASEEGIDQIMWMLRPSKLTGVLPPLT